LTIERVLEMVKDIGKLYEEEELNAMIEAPKQMKATDAGQGHCRH